MKSLSLRKRLWLLIFLMSLTTFFGALSIWDTLHGKKGVEDLFFSLPMLLGGVTTVVLLALQLVRQSKLGTATLPTPDPVIVAQRTRRIRKLALATALPTITLLIGLYSVTWALRTGTVWIAVVIGGITLAVTWTVIVVMLRPKAER